MTDTRYTINLEYCGYITKHHVVRFCGQFISSHCHYADAVKSRDRHAAQRNAILTGEVES